MSTREKRDKTLSRIRTTTAVTGIGAVLVGGALVGWLEHGVDDEAGSTSTSTGTDDSTSSSSSSDYTLTSPSTSTDSGTGDTSQPGVTSGGS